MNEFELIDHFFKRSTSHPLIKLGVGDDCAIIDVPADQELVFSMDTLVADVHFFADGPAKLIAERALRVCLSDLAAMGAEPLCFTMSLSLPHINEDWLQNFSEGLFAVANEFSCALVGGDTVKGPLVITLQVHGLVPKAGALRRSGATVGDLVAVSGHLGSGAAGLAVLKNKLRGSERFPDFFRNSYFRPSPKITLGVLLRDYASAAIDISDGLLADLGHICRASHCGARLKLESLPIAPPIQQLVGEAQAMQWALCGGDDYQLCFTVSPDQVSALQDKLSAHGEEISLIGQITEGEGISCCLHGETYPFQHDGYRHF